MKTLMIKLKPYIYKLLLPYAVKVLAYELNNDESYRLSWKANIAMPIYDKTRGMATHSEIHKIANEAAEQFLQNLTRDVK